MPSDSDDRSQYDQLDTSQPLKLHDALANLDAERAILACLMMHEDTWDSLTGLIHESDFSDHRHRRIFSTIRALANQNKSLDPISVSGALRDSDLFGKVGGQNYLMEIEEAIFDHRSLLDYKDIVRATAIRRELIQAADHIHRIAKHPKDRSIDALITEAESEVLKVGEERDDEDAVARLKNRIDSAIGYIEELSRNEGKIPGLVSGFERLDDLTAGFRKSDLIVLAARPSMGKTALSLNICTNILLNVNKPIVFFSLEQDREQLIRRMLSAVAGVSYKKLDLGQDLTTQDWQQLESARHSLSKVEFFIIDRPNIALEEMRSHIRRINRELTAPPHEATDNTVALVVVDYLHLMRPPREGNQPQRSIEVGEISRGLKALAKEFQVPVLVLSQLNREVEKRENKRPRMSDLRDSGEIEQDSDLILFIYRDEVYDENSAQKGKAEIIIGKHRNGPQGEFTLDYQANLMKFSNEGDTAYRASVPYTSTSTPMPTSGADQYYEAEDEPPL